MHISGSAAKVNAIKKTRQILKARILGSISKNLTAFKACKHLYQVGMPTHLLYKVDFTLEIETQYLQVHSKCSLVSWACWTS